MAKYSEAEKKAFREKDLRISKLSLLKVCIDKVSDLEELDDKKDEIKSIVSDFLDFVYKNGSTVGVPQPTDSIDWPKIAEGLDFAAPNETNIKVLNDILSEYKKESQKANDNPSAAAAEILQWSMKHYHRYPTRKASGKQVIDNLVIDNSLKSSKQKGY